MPTQNFDSVTAPALPAGFTDGSSGAAKTQATGAYSAPNCLVFDATVGAGQFLGITTPETSPNRRIRVKAKADAGVNAFVITRMGTFPAPGVAYYLAQFIAGPQAGAGLFLEAGGTSIGELFTSNIPANTWLELSLDPFGNSIRVSLKNLSNGQYLQTSGNFSTTHAYALNITNTAFPAAGYSSIGVYQPGPTRVLFDDLSIEDSIAGTDPDPDPDLSTVINATNAGILRSRSWIVDGTALKTVNIGQYLKTSFVGPFCVMNVDGEAHLAGNNQPIIRWRIDSSAWQRQAMTQETTQIILATGLADTTHTLEVWFGGVVTTTGSPANWFGNGRMFKVLSFAVKAGSVLTAPSRKPFELLTYGDSFLDGASMAYDGTNTKYAGEDDTIMDATKSVGVLFAADLNAEPDIVSWSGQGFTTGTAGGGVGTWAETYDKIMTGVSRLSGGLFSPMPTGILNLLGTNGGSSETATTIKTAYEVLRAAMPTGDIVFAVPSSQFNRDALIAGLAAYKTAHPSDTRVFLLDGNANFANGSTSPDGVHLNAPGAAIYEDALFADAAAQGAFGLGVADTTRPTVSSATINAAGTLLSFVFSKPVTGVSASDYTLSGGATLSSVSGSGANRTMAISPGVYQSQTRTLAYTGTGTVDTASTPNALLTFSGAAVTNNSTVPVPVSDTTPPTLSVRTIPSAGTTLTATLSESGCLPTSGTGGFTLTGTAGSRTVTSWVISGTTLTLTLSGVVYGTDTPLLTYSRAATTDDITDAAGNLLANFTAASVTNGSTQTAPVSPDPGTGTSSADTLRLLTVQAPDGGTQYYEDGTGDLIRTRTYLGNVYATRDFADGSGFSATYTPAEGD